VGLTRRRGEREGGGGEVYLPMSQLDEKSCEQREVRRGGKEDDQNPGPDMGHLVFSSEKKEEGERKGKDEK